MQSSRTAAVTSRLTATLTHPLYIEGIIVYVALYLWIFWCDFSVYLGAICVRTNLEMSEQH